MMVCTLQVKMQNVEQQNFSETIEENLYDMQIAGEVPDMMSQAQAKKKKKKR
jgi:hypothetical protein